MPEQQNTKLKENLKYQTEHKAEEQFDSYMKKKIAKAVNKLGLDNS